MRKLCLLAFALLVGCQGSSLDEVLRRIHDGLDTAHATTQLLEDVHALVCAPEFLPVGAADECAEAAGQLAGARRAEKLARKVLSDADAGAE